MDPGYLGLALQEIAKMPGQYQDGQARAVQTQQALNQYQQNQLALTLAQQTQPMKVFDAYADMVRKSNYVPPSVTQGSGQTQGSDDGSGAAPGGASQGGASQGGADLDHIKPIDMSQINSLIEDKYGSMEEAQSHFATLTPQEQMTEVTGLLQDAQDDGPIGMQHLKPIGTAHTIIHQTPDGKLVAMPMSMNPLEGANPFDPQSMQQTAMNLAPLAQSQAAVDIQKNQAKNQGAWDRAVLRSDTQKEVTESKNDNSQELRDKINGSKKSSSSPDEKFDAESLKTLKQMFLKRHDSLGRVDKGVLSAMAGVISSLRTPAAKQAATQAYGSMLPDLVSAGAPPSPGASAQAPVAGAVKMRQKSTGKLMWVKDNKIYGEAK